MTRMAEQTFKSLAFYNAYFTQLMTQFINDELQGSLKSYMNEHIYENYLFN